MAGNRAQNNKREHTTVATAAGAGAPDPAAAAPSRARDRATPVAAFRRLLPACLFVVCMAVYLSNGDFLPGGDQEGNMLFSINLLKRHSLSLGPLDAPYSFFWTLEQPGRQPLNVTVAEWTDAADEAYRDGRLRTRGHRYFLAETARPETFVNTFGLGAPLFGLPVYALLDLFVDLENDRYWWWHGGALTASLLTAGAVLLVFLSARRFVRPVPAALAALAFGLGSCVWPVSSQALWQHPASTFCLALGAWFLLRSTGRPLSAAWCGAALGMAVLCRPTTAVAVLCMGAYLLCTDRRGCAAYVLGGLPFLAVLLVYNGYYFDSPLVFGQTVASELIALRGEDTLWQSSWLESVPGLFISPSRGLVWFSPVLVLGFATAAAVWREPRYRVLIPLQAAVVVMILVAGKWFDWFGGLTWGYRSIIDTTPFLALLMVPLLERMRSRPVARIVFGGLLLWSVAAQFVGAWSYSVAGWHNMTHQYDDPNHASVWMWRRPQIGYHVTNFAAERAAKKRLMATYTSNRHPILVLRDGEGQAPEAALEVLVSRQDQMAATHNYAEDLRRQGRYEEAIEEYRALLQIDPQFAPAYSGMGDALFRMGRHEDALAALRHVLSLQPGPAVAGSTYRLMGRCEQELGRLEAALRHYQRAIAIHPEDTLAIDLLARLQFARERYAEAAALFRTLIEIQPDTAPSHANLGATIYHLGQIEDAIRSYEHALSLDPDMESARTTLEHLRGRAR